MLITEQNTPAVVAKLGHFDVGEALVVVSDSGPIDVIHNKLS